MTEMQRQPGFPLRRTPQDEITAEPQGPPQDPELQRAQVRVVVPLSPAERVALQTYLERIVGRPVDLDVNLDATILGGVWMTS